MQKYTRSLITLMRSKNPETVNKVFYATEHGRQKRSVAHVTEAQAIHVDVSTAQLMMDLLERVTQSTNEVLCTGVFNNAGDRKFKIMTETRLAQMLGREVGEVGVHELDDKLLAARLKRAMQPCKWILLDADTPKDMPPELAAMSLSERLAKLEPIIAGISKCERIELRSSSSRVRQAGGEFGGASHGWIRVSDPYKIDTLKAHLRTETDALGLSYISKRHSSKDGSQVGSETRTVIDLATLDTGRLVFCAKPQSEIIGDEIGDAAITLVNAGCGELDISHLEIPTKERLRVARQKTGIERQYNSTANGLSSVVHGLLTLDTPYQVKGTTKPVRDWIPEAKVAGKLRGEAPFRDSQSEAAFMSVDNFDNPRIYDIGNNTTYLIAQKPMNPIVQTGDSKGDTQASEGDDWPTFVDFKYLKDGTPKPTATRENLETLIDWAGVDVRYDVYRRDLVAWHNGGEVSNSVDALVKSLAAKYGLPASTVLDQLDAVAMDRPINKPLHWLQSLTELDGDPLAEWLTECGMVDAGSDTPIQEQWGYVIWKRFFVGCCAAADQLEKTPRKDAISKFEEVIVLLSEQGNKKTSAIRGLLPPELRSYFGGGINLQTANKDSVINATSYWIGEIGELDATFRKSDISALKAFLSMTEDNIRMPYDRRAKWYPRRTVFFATVNEGEFLQDTTGNRRYLPITLSQRLVYSEELGAGIFAQAWKRYIGGEQWWLSDEEKPMAVENQKGKHGNRLIELIRETFNMGSNRREFKLKPSTILEVMGYRGDAVAKNVKQLAHALRELDIEKADGSYMDKRCYLMPPMQPDALRKWKAYNGEVSDASF